MNALRELLPIEEEVVAMALTATSEKREEQWTDEEYADEIAFSRKHADTTLSRLIEQDSRRVMFGMASAARRMRDELAADAAYLRMVADEIDRKNTSRRTQAAWLEEQVKQVAETLLPEGSKHVDMPGIARVQFTDRKRTVKIDDPEAFIEWAAEFGHTELYEEKTTLKVNDAKAVAKTALLEMGNLLPGVEDVPGERTSVLQWAAPPEGRAS